MKKLIATLFVLALGAVLSGRAYALTEASTMDVTATMVASCAVTVTGVSFPDSDGTAYLVANGDVTVNCTSGAPYNIAFDAGSNHGLASNYPSRRAVADGAGNYAAYILDKPDSTGQWGDSDYANTYSLGGSLADTSTGADQPHTIYGYMPSPSVVLGAYSDIVNVTLYY